MAVYEGRVVSDEFQGGGALPKVEYFEHGIVSAGLSCSPRARVSDFVPQA